MGNFIYHIMYFYSNDYNCNIVVILPIYCYSLNIQNKDFSLMASILDHPEECQVPVFLHSIY